MGTCIWATYNKSFDIGCKVVKWDEKDGIDFHPYDKYSKRNIGYDELKELIRQLTIHWSVTYRASHMKSGLIARGLSCNFMIDDDCDENGYATIYQCLPIQHAGWSQGACNLLGPGVEISYMPQAWSDPNAYSENRQKKYGVSPHDIVTAKIHGTKLKVFLPSKAQMNSLYQLIWGFHELFPSVPMKFPRDNSGGLIQTVVKGTKEYSGLVNHYHLNRGKIDAAGIDMIDLENEIDKRIKVGY